MGVLNRAELLLQARNYSGSGAWLDESGNGHDAQLGSTSGADTNDPLFKPYDGSQYLYLPGSSGNYLSTADVNLLSADNAHGEQSAGDWATAGTNTIASVVASAESITHPMTALLPNAGFTKVWKVTYQDDTDLASLAMTLTAAAHSFSVYCYLPVGWDGGDVTIDDGGTFASESSVTSQSADEGTLGSWQQIWRKFTPAGGDLTGTLTLTAAGTPTAGKVLYLASACARTGTSTTFVPSLRIVGDLDLRAKIGNMDLSARRNIFFASDTGGPNYTLDVLDTGAYRFVVLDSGPAERFVDSSVAGTADSGPVEVRATLDVSVPAWTFYEDGTQLGSVGSTTVTGAALQSGPAPLRIGNNAATFFGSGDIYWAEVRDGIDGPVVARYDATDAAEPFATQTGTVDGRTWTYNRSASGLVSTVVDRDMFLLTTDDYFQIADDAGLDFAADESLTIMALVRTSSIGAGARWIAGKKNGIDVTAGYSIQANAATPGHLVADGAAAGGTATAGNLAAHTLATVAGRRDVVADVVQAFKDGTGGSTAADNTTATLANALTFRIGASSHATTPAAFWEGQIVAVALWREALSDADILQAGLDLIYGVTEPSTGRLLVLGLL